MADDGDDRGGWGSACPAPAGLKSCRLELEHGSVLVMSYPLQRCGVARALTSAERDVARRVLEGASNAQIACTRGSSARTVANQLASIFRKLGVASRTELAQRLASTDFDGQI